MTVRMIATGTLGVVLAVVWAMSFLYQRHNVDFLTAMFLADSPVVLKVSSLWSVLQIWIPALLVIPVTAASVGAMFGVRAMVRVLRIAAAASAVLSLGILLIYAGLSAPGVAGGGPLLIDNPQIRYELLVAAGTLGMQLVLLALCRRSGSNDRASLVSSPSAGDQNQMPDRTREPSSGDPQLAALPTGVVAQQSALRST